MNEDDTFDARTYFLETVGLLNQWPIRAIEQFKFEGFTRIRLEHIEPHPVYHLHMRAPLNNLTSRQAGRLIRRIIKQAGTIPRGGFTCLIDRRGHVEVAFVLEV